MRIVVTGSSGFIGSAAAQKLVQNGHVVLGLDNQNDYYDVSIKNEREKLNKLSGKNYTFHKTDIADANSLFELFKNFLPDVVLNLAAQAGVRYSITNPSSYVESNLVGFGNVLEACRKFNIKHLVYASSSSVYGANALAPFSEQDNVDHPLSLYAATKRCNELMAHSYSHLFSLPTTGLRFFTVYGPWGRPDMALFKFTKAIFSGEPIEVFNKGEHARDFTYIDDITESIHRIISKPPVSNPISNVEKVAPAINNEPWAIYNIGRGSPVKLSDFIKQLELAIGKTAKKIYLPLQPGDVKNTHADTSKLTNLIGYTPMFDIETGINNFVSWYRSYYRL